MASNFSFLGKYWTELALLGETAESYLYSDPNACIFKIGMLAEQIVQGIFSYEKIELPEDTRQSNLIRVLKYRSIIPENIDNILYSIRRARNDAVHVGCESTDRARILLQMAYNLCIWYMEVYGDWSFVAAEYVEPADISSKKEFTSIIESHEEKLKELLEEINRMKTDASEKSAMKYLESLGVAPHFEEGDAEILKEAASKVDFMGVNYYKTCSIEYNPLDGVDSLGGENNTGKKGTAEMEGVPGMYKVPANKNLPTTDWDWTIDPMGLRFACRKITSRYDLPIVISENGLGAFDKLEDGKIHDSYRIEYLRNHIEELKKACDDGCRILAYCTWSYTDLLSWLNGYQKRYGFVYVDRDEDENSGTLKRIPKDSYYWYKKVIETNGEEL